ncbi:MAG: ParB/RepB/Spo0J family partition protein [Bacteroidaceae bacterium]|nr:ParB/RepB/Spo0J family partition protein [Bacteroidaceae bacterium]
MAVHKKYSALGRGLDTLDAGKGLDALISTTEVHTNGSSSIHEIELEKIIVNPNQPRHEFEPEALQELAASIAEIGIIQPITLRKMDDGTYQIIAGERRYRASQIAGLQKVPAYIRTVDDENMMEMALIENIQREDLNSLEIALAYQNLLEQYNMTQEQLSTRVGKKRATIANYLRLLHLPAPIQMALQNKEIDMGHARALLSLTNPKDMMKIFQEIIKNGYSVRKVEELVKELNAGNTASSDNKKIKTKTARLPEEYNALRIHLSELFKTKVEMTYSSKGKGKIILPFENEEELEKVIDLLDQIKKN